MVNKTELTKREIYAGLAMMGMLANSYLDGSGTPLSELNTEAISKLAVIQADSLIAALKKDHK